MNDPRPEIRTDLPAEGSPAPGAGSEALNGAPAAPRPASAKTKVLLIEDDPTIRMLLQMGLRKHKFDCVAAENGRAAQGLLQSVRPDLIVVDLMMPVMDGLAFIQWLRHTQHDSTTPVLVFSTVQDPKIMQEVLKTGADVFAGKPMHLKQLVTAINKLAGAPRGESREP